MYILFLPDSRNCFFIYLVCYFHICIYHFFIVHFVFISPLSYFDRHETHSTIYVWFDFITNCIQFHYNIRYRKFALKCKRFETRKEMKRKICYNVFLKNMFFIYMSTIFLFYNGGCNSQLAFIGIFQNIFWHWATIFSLTRALDKLRVSFN